MTKVICDTDFLIALHLENDSNHSKALDIWKRNSEVEYYLSNLTKYELMMVLSRRLEQKYANEVFLAVQENFTKEIWFEKSSEEEITNFYLNSKNKNISFFDLNCLFTAKKFKAKIASFDSFYPKEMLLN